MTSILQHIDWLNGRVPDAVRTHLRQLVAVVGFLPHKQPLAVVTADAVLLAANRPFLELLGTSSDEQLGADWDDFMPGWSARAGSGEASAEPRTLAFEDYLLPAGEGDPVWVRVVACPVFAPEEGDAEGEALAAWALFVLDQRPGRQEGDERRRRAILDLLLESPNEFVVQLSPQGEVEYLSPSLRRVMGVFADGAEGKPLADVHALAAGDFAARYASLLDDLLRPPYRSESEMAMITAEGERIIQWRFESLLADGGAVGGVLGVGNDVTERRRAEDERARSELRLRTLVEATTQIMWTTGPGGVIDRPIESWSAFTGQTDEEVRGDGWTDAIHPDDRERVIASWNEAVAGQAVYDCEYRLRAGDGEYHWIEAHAVPLPCETAGEPQYFGVGHDITKRRRAEEAARRRVELESIVAAVSTRLATASLDTVDLAVDFALGETGRCLGADRVSLYQLAPDRVHLDRVRVWRRETGLLEDGDTSYDIEEMAWVRERAAAGQPIVIHTVHDLPPEAAPVRAALSAMGLDAVLAVPVLQESTLVGLLAYGIEADSGDEMQPRWKEDDASLMRLIADQLASLIMWRADELNLRSIADGFLSFGPDVGKNLTQICRAAAVITAADLVLYTRRRGRELVIEAGWNVPDGLPRGTPAEGRLDADVMARNDEQVHVERDLQDTIYAHTSPVVECMRARTYAGFPVIVGGQAIGVLSCLFTGDASLRESQLELLRVLGRAAVVEEERRNAIEERVLGLAQLEQAMERMVGTLSGAVGTRDPYTAGHEKRVSQLAVAIGKKLGLHSDDLRLLRLAATVHDVGKITVPAEILSKPTRLSEAEFAIIRRHSAAGWDLLEPAGLPASVTDAVLQHHERLDGSGYPGGLKDDDIGEFARIIAVADVVEAMSSHRPYRPAIGIEPALEEIERGRGVRFDERAADACLRLFRDEGFAFTE